MNISPKPSRVDEGSLSKPSTEKVTQKNKRVSNVPAKKYASRTAPIDQKNRGFQFSSAHALRPAHYLSNPEPSFQSGPDAASQAKVDDALTKINQYLHANHDNTGRIQTCLFIVEQVSALKKALSGDRKETNFKYIENALGEKISQALSFFSQDISILASKNMAEQYMKKINDVFNIFHLLPNAKKTTELRKDISEMYKQLINAELNYLEYRTRFKENDGIISTINQLQQVITDKTPCEYHRFLEPNVRNKFLKKNNSLKKKKPCKADSPLTYGNEIDQAISKGEFKQADHLLGSTKNPHRHPIRRLGSLLTTDLDRILAPSKQNKGISTPQDIELFHELVLFARSYPAMTKNYAPLNKSVFTILSEVSTRLMISSDFKTMDSGSVFKAMKTLPDINLLSNQVGMKWEELNNKKVTNVKNNASKLTDETVDTAINSIFKFLPEQNKPLPEQLEKAVHLVKPLVESKDQIGLLSFGKKHTTRLNNICHRLYIHLFSDIFQALADCRTKFGAKNYDKQIQAMAQYKARCIKNQALIFALKDEDARNNWKLSAAKAWGQSVTAFQKKTVITDKDVDDLLSLKSIASDMRCHNTRCRLKVALIHLFKKAKNTPENVKVSVQKLIDLASWLPEINSNIPERNYKEIETQNSLIRCVKEWDAIRLSFMLSPPAETKRQPKGTSVVQKADIQIITDKQLASDKQPVSKQAKAYPSKSSIKPDISLEKSEESKATIEPNVESTCKKVAIKLTSVKESTPPNTFNSMHNAQSQLSEEKLAHDKVVTGLTNEMQTLNHRISEMNDQIRTRDNSISDLKQQIGGIQQSSQTILKLSQEKLGPETTVAELKKKLDTINLSIKLNDGDILTLSNQVSELKKKADIIPQLNQQIASLSAENDPSSTTIKEAIEQKNATELELQNLRQQQEISDKKHADKLQSFKTKKGYFQRKANFFETAIKDHENNVESLKKDLLRYESDVLRYTQEVERTSNEISRMVEDKKALEKQITEIMQRNEQANSELTASRETNSALSKNLLSLQSDVKDLEKQNRIVTNELSRVSAALSQKEAAGKQERKSVQKPLQQIDSAIIQAVPAKTQASSEQKKPLSLTNAQTLNIGQLRAVSGCWEIVNVVSKALEDKTKTSELIYFAGENISQLAGALSPLCPTYDVYFYQLRPALGELFTDEGPKALNTVFDTILKHHQQKGNLELTENLNSLRFRLLHIETRIRSLISKSHPYPQT